ncbi:lipocalin family protein [Mesobacillus jeotgali]|uniref:lipocalin family protein n=1 Tax=Mesobacillus jeotgali TaxID=129985 RepID=UPI000C81BF2A|nr:lipocalin family protein [Mesobacillus jeotgali]
MNEEHLDRISLPEDAGPHGDSNIEWWYFFSFLNGDKGGRYAVMASFFRVGEFEIGKGHYIIHTLIDLDSKKRYNFSSFDSKVKLAMVAIYLPFYLLLHPTDTRIWRLYKKLLKGDIPAPHTMLEAAKINQHPPELFYGSHRLRFKGEEAFGFDAILKEKNSEIELEFTPMKPVALIGGDGKPDDLYYYSTTRNSVNGMIKTDSKTENVSGTGWFDHQWGRDYSLVKGAGWDWFGLMLSDGRELLLNQMSPGNPMANVIEEDGRVHFTRNITFQKIKYWKSLKTNARYPVEWEIRIPDFGIELHVEAEFPNQEMLIIGPIQAIWEGACKVTGREKLADGTSRPLDGIGFMELVGYAN